MKVGDIQIDERGEWVIVSVTGRGRISRVQRNSHAHRLHAAVDPEVAQSLEEEVDETATASEDRPDAA